MGSFLKPTVIISQVLLKTIHVLATEQVNSTLEIDNSISADNDHWSGENLCHGTKEAQKDVILWWGCRGGRAHANGVHHCFAMFPTWENEHDWYIFVLNCSNQGQE